MDKAIKEVSIVKDEKQKKWVKPEIKDKNTELNPVFVCYNYNIQPPCPEYTSW